MDKRHPLRRDYPCATHEYRDAATSALRDCREALDADTAVTPVARSPAPTPCSATVRVGGVLETAVTVECGTRLGDIGALADYFGSADHAVVDADTRRPLARETAVGGDMAVRVLRVETVRVWVEVDVAGSGSADAAEDLRVAVADSADDIYDVAVAPGEGERTFVVDLVVAAGEADSILDRLADCVLLSHPSSS